MKLLLKPLLLSLLCCVCFTSEGLAQKNFDGWLQETEINGSKLKILRVPADEITHRFKMDILSIQRQLDRCMKEYLAGKETYKSSLESEIEFMQVQAPEWPSDYYVQEVKAYIAYNVVWEKKDHDSLMNAVNQREEKRRFAEQVQGYSFINKPFVLIKTDPSPKSMTMAKVYRGSYVEVMGAIDGTDYIAITVGGQMTGYVQQGDVVDSLSKVEAPEEEMVVFRSRRYYKYEESAEYLAMIKKLAGPIRTSGSSGGAGGKSTTRYYTGPRGGCYYINSKGNKVYVDHSYCR